MGPLLELASVTVIPFALIAQGPWFQSQLVTLIPHFLNPLVIMQKKSCKIKTVPSNVGKSAEFE
jgi:hypothetical protein